MIRVTNTNTGEIIRVMGTSLPPGHSREIHEDDYAKWRVENGNNALHANINLKVDSVPKRRTPAPKPKPKAATVKDKAVKQKQEAGDGDKG